MRRTKPPALEAPASAKTPVRGKKKPDTLPDGRVLGQKAADFVPKHMRDKIPDAPEPRRKGRARRTTHAINMMCRTRMPLAFSPDGELVIDGHKQIRMRGLNQAKFNALLAGISSGMRISEAAKLIGAKASTIRSWLAKADKGLHPYNLICAALLEAEAEMERQLLDSIREQGTVRLEYEEKTVEESTNEHGETTTKTRTVTKTRWPQYLAAAWILERTRPEVYRSDREIGATETMDIGAEIEAMLQVSDVRVATLESSPQPPEEANE